MGSDLKTFGERLRKTRLERGFEQDDIAKILGHKGHGSISHWERNKSLPNIIQVQTVAKFLNVEPSWLAYGLEQSPPTEDGKIAARCIVKMPEALKQSILKIMLDVEKSNLARDSFDNPANHAPTAPPVKMPIHLALVRVAERLRRIEEAPNVDEHLKEQISRSVVHVAQLIEHCREIHDQDKELSILVLSGTNPADDAPLL